MKKEYIKPEMQVYELETMQLMAKSPVKPKLNYGDYPDDDNDELFYLLLQSHRLTYCFYKYSEHV